MAFKFRPEILLFIGFCFFFYFIQTYVSTDIHLHNAFIAESIDGKITVPGNFLYYLMVYLSGFGVKEWLPFSSSVILSFSVTLKYYLSKNIIKEICFGNSLILKKLDVLALAPLFIIALPSVFFFVKGYFTLYSLPVNTWHNSTTIFLFPFAILLFWTSYKQLQSYEPKNNYLIAFLILINVLAKPSYLFVFIIAYPLALLLRYRFQKEFWKSIVPIVIGIILVVVEYLIIYQFSKSETNDSKVIFSPFFYQKLIFHNNWLMAIGGLIISFIGVFLFPALLLFSKKIKVNLLLQYGFWTAMIGILIYLLFAETGYRMWNGNFIWQVIVCNYIFLLLCFANMLNALTRIDISATQKKIWIGSYSIYLLFGIAFIFKIFILGDCH